MAKHLGIDFSWILIDLGGQVGAKLGSKIDQKSIKKLSVFQTRFWSASRRPTGVPGRVRRAPTRQHGPGPSRWGGVGEGSVYW